MLSATSMIHALLETFEKRAIGHCEEAKGRRSNPITIR
jgi:hypothetical protein